MKNLIFIFLLAVALSSCDSDKNKKFIYNEGAVWGTLYHVIYESPKGVDLQPEMELEMKKIDNSLSMFNQESTIAKINSNLSTDVDPLFKKCFLKAVEISEKTEGAFDITVAPLVNAWGFGFKQKENVTLTLIDSLMKSVGYQKIRIENDHIVKDHPDTKLDASAIAKGLGVDVVGDFLASKGCKNYMVEIGGEVVAKGVNREGKIWRIGINKPKENALFDSEDLQSIIALNNRAMATSGNYRNFYEEGGKRYAHTIDPKSGYPIQHSLLSSTVLANDCMTADAYATAFMVLGVEKALEIVNNDPELEGYFIVAEENGENKVVYSSGFEALIEKSPTE